MLSSPRVKHPTTLVMNQRKANMNAARYTISIRAPARW
ncbi:hypothetical protein FrEUN1fDRAFT_4291 [Parafrankia sp. EUN1f]|nr:hypothetical protein FrEUN1fDRAFT_4291 [Parafrankia sp. EUN1f]